MLDYIFGLGLLILWFMWVFLFFLSVLYINAMLVQGSGGSVGRNRI